MTSFDTLTTSLVMQPTIEASVETLVHGLAERIKATSNDQNVQRLARELKAAAPDLIRAVAAKTSAINSPAV